MNHEVLKSDEKLGPLIEKIGSYTLEIGHPEGHLAALVRSIVFQQLSGKAAATIYGRLRNLFEEFPQAEELLALSDETLRSCGLSGQKISYLRDLCQKTADKTLDFAHLILLEGV